MEPWVCTVNVEPLTLPPPVEDLRKAGAPMKSHRQHLNRCELLVASRPPSPPQREGIGSSPQKECADCGSRNLRYC